MRRLSGNRQNCSLYIRLFADELQAIKEAAAREGKSVSEYVRARVLGNQAPVTAAHVPDPPGEIVTAPVKEQPLEEKPQRGVCSHGTKRGYRCWQCGGLAKIASDAIEEKTPAKKRKR